MSELQNTHQLKKLTVPEILFKKKQKWESHDSECACFEAIFEDK